MMLYLFLRVFIIRNSTFFFLTFFYDFFLDITWYHTMVWHKASRLSNLSAICIFFIFFCWIRIQIIESIELKINIHFVINLVFFYLVSVHKSYFTYCFPL